MLLHGVVRIQRECLGSAQRSSCSDKNQEAQSSRMQNIHWLRPKICVLALVFCFSSHIPIPDLSDTLGGSQCKTSSHLFYTPVCFHSYCYIPCQHHFQIPDCNPLLGVFICTLLPLLSIFHTALKIIFLKITLIHALHLLRTLSWFFFEI